jgi:hypothetical protein
MIFIFLTSYGCNLYLKCSLSILNGYLSFSDLKCENLSNFKIWDCNRFIISIILHIIEVTLLSACIYRVGFYRYSEKQFWQLNMVPGCFIHILNLISFDFSYFDILNFSTFSWIWSCKLFNELLFWEEILLITVFYLAS